MNVIFFTLNIVSLTHHILLLFKVDFELTGVTRTTQKGTPSREWKNKHSPYRFWQQQNSNANTWNTGVFNKKLKSMANNAMGLGILPKARAQYVLEMRGILQPSGHFMFEVGKPTGNPVKQRVQLFSMEEDLINHVGEAFSIVSSGCPMRIFDDPFVKDFLKLLEPRHRTVYRLKLVRLIRCIVDVQAREVSLCGLFCSMHFHFI